MKRPEGFAFPGKELLVPVEVSICGLKQSQRCRNTSLHINLKKMGFIQTDTNPCVYRSSEDQGTQVKSPCLLATQVQES